MTSQEKMFAMKTFTRNKQGNPENEVKPSKQRNLNPIIVPDDVDHFSEISAGYILNIDSKIPEFFQDFLSEESISEIGENISKFTNLFKNLASRLIFSTIFLFSAIFAERCENLQCKNITTRARRRRQPVSPGNRKTLLSSFGIWRVHPLAENSILEYCQA